MNELIQSGVGQITGICRTLPKMRMSICLLWAVLKNADFLLHYREKRGNSRCGTGAYYAKMKWRIL